MKRLFLAIDEFLRPAERLCGSRDRVGNIEIHEFPDGESSLRIFDDPRDREVVVVAPLHRPNRLLVPLLLLGEELRLRGAKRLIFVAPYLPYMRQDAEFHPGEIVSARALGHLLSKCWDAVYTVDPHLHRIHDLAEVFTVPTTVVAAAPAIGRWISNHVERPILIGPDEESEQWVRSVAAGLDCPWLVLRKNRRGDHDVEVEVPDAFSAQGRTAVFIDDIISTGHTLIEARQELQKRDVNASIAVAIHGVFADGARERLEEAGFQRIVTSNTIPNETSEIDALAELARCFET